MQSVNKEYIDNKITEIEDENKSDYKCEMMWVDCVDYTPHIEYMRQQLAEKGIKAKLILKNYGLAVNFEKEQIKNG